MTDYKKIEELKKKILRASKKRETETGYVPTLDEILQEIDDYRRERWKKRTSKRKGQSMKFSIELKKDLKKVEEDRKKVIDKYNETKKNKRKKV